MAWQTDMVEMLRVLIGDDNATQIYSDDKLTKLLVVAGFQVANELKFSQDFACDIDALNISPDPTVAASKDDSFVNLTCFKAACILDRGEAALAVKKGISVSDNRSSVDLRGPMQGRLAILKDGWCAVYQKSKLEYQSGLVRVAGAAVMTPFRLYGKTVTFLNREY